MDDMLYESRIIHTADGILCQHGGIAAHEANLQEESFSSSGANKEHMIFETHRGDAVACADAGADRMVTPPVREQ